MRVNQQKGLAANRIRLAPEVRCPSGPPITSIALLLSLILRERPIMDFSLHEADTYNKLGGHSPTYAGEYNFTSHPLKIATTE